MATGQGLGGQLLYMVGLVMVLLLIVSDMRPGRRGGRRPSLDQYKSGFVGPVVVGVLLPGTFLPPDSAGALAVAAGMFLGLASLSRTTFDATSTVVAVLGLVMVSRHVVTFLVQRRDTGTLETLFNLSVFVLVCACFLGAALVGTVWAALPWGQGLTTHALEFAIVLEMLMLLADPAWDVLHTLQPVTVLVSVGAACLVAIVLGVFSHPSVLSLLAVGFAITVAVHGTDLRGPQQDLGLVIGGIVLAFVVRCLVHPLFARA